MTIEPVPRRGQAEAIRFLAAGRRRDDASEAQATAYEHLLRAEGRESVRLWWARRWGRCYAAAMVLEHPGRTGALFHCPVAAPGVRRDALIEVISAASHEALEGGLAFVQALTAPGGGQDGEILRAGGYEFLAELVYLRLGLMSEPPGCDSAGESGGADLAWRAYGQFDEAELASVIEATYVDSQDCPILIGSRPVADVIRGHKTSGVFRADTWWLLEQEGKPAGCVLVNDSRYTNTSEVVYLGVVPGHRGRGLSRLMLRRAACTARGRGRTALKLAVDAANTHAMQVYEAEHFEEIERRWAYLSGRCKRHASESRLSGL